MADFWSNVSIHTPLFRRILALAFTFLFLEQIEDLVGQNELDIEKLENSVTEINATLTGIEGEFKQELTKSIKLQTSNFLTKSDFDQLETDVKDLESNYEKHTQTVLEQVIEEGYLKT